MLLSQEKTSVDPPFDQEPYTVAKFKGTRMTIQREDTVKTQNLRRLKLVKERPRHLVASNKTKKIPNGTSLTMMMIGTLLIFIMFI